MIFEALIRDALRAGRIDLADCIRSGPVPVRPYTRKRPYQDAREACLERLRREVGA